MWFLFATLSLWSFKSTAIQYWKKSCKPNVSCIRRLRRILALGMVLLRNTSLRSDPCYADFASNWNTFLRDETIVWTRGNFDFAIRLSGGSYSVRNISTDERDIQTTQPSSPLYRNQVGFSRQRRTAFFFFFFFVFPRVPRASKICRCSKESCGDIITPRRNSGN